MSLVNVNFKVKPAFKRRLLEIRKETGVPTAEFARRTLEAAVEAHARKAESAEKQSPSSN